MILRILLITLAALSLAAGPALAQLTPLEKLGKELFFDKISDPDSMSCADCHGEKVGFTGPIPGINKKGSVYRGAVPQRFGNRKPPSSGYATPSPILNYVEFEEDGEMEALFVGGNFWDGRATGWLLGNPAADQALGPFLNPVEQNNPDKQAVIDQVCSAKYADLFVDEFQAYQGMETDPCIAENLGDAYDFLGIAIMAYEDSAEVNQFSSKYDAYLAGEAELTAQEAEGMALFNGQAMCSACHPSDGTAPLFTDFTYDNLGVPRNPENPFYRMDQVYVGMEPINPEGSGWVDRGLGGFLEGLVGKSDWRTLPYVPAEMAALTDDELLILTGENEGKQKVPTLRNVGKRPGNNFTKAYTHNGYFKSLKGIVHFYNTRDTKAPCPPNTEYTEKEALVQNCWPAPEVAANVNEDELGDLGLSPEQEDAIVAFMETLSDGFEMKKSR